MVFLPPPPHACQTPTWFQQYAVEIVQAKRRLAAWSPSAALPPWRGHVHSGDAALKQDSRHRPMDLRAVAAGDPGSAAAGVAAGQPASANVASGSWEALLRAGSCIAAEVRAAVKAEAGYRMSAGIASNKLLAKLCRCAFGLVSWWGPTQVLPGPAADASSFIFIHSFHSTAATSCAPDASAFGFCFRCCCVWLAHSTPSLRCDAPPHAAAYTNQTTRQRCRRLRPLRLWRRCPCGPCRAWVRFAALLCRCCVSSPDTVGHVRAGTWARRSALMIGALQHRGRCQWQSSNAVRLVRSHICPPLPGYKTEEGLQALGVATVADLRALPRQQLSAKFGARVGSFLFEACRGKVGCRGQQLAMG